MDYRVNRVDDTTIGQALSARAVDMFGALPTILEDAGATLFLDNFPPGWVLVIIDENGDPHNVVNNCLH